MSVENEELLNEEEEIQDEDLDPELEAEAREMGWRPKSEFKGKPENWVDANSYVEKGRHVTPIIRARNAKLESEALTNKTKIGNLEAENKKMRDRLEALEKRDEETHTQQVNATMAQLKDKLKEAIADRDVDTEFEIREAIEKLQKAPARKTPANDPPPNVDEAGNKIHPELKAWMGENPWFGNDDDPADKRKTKEVIRLTEDLVEDGSKLKGRALFDKALEEYDKRNNKGRKPDERFEAGNNRQGGRDTGAKSYNSLPRDAKDMCDSEAAYMVGEGRPFKTEAEWRKHYAKTFFEG